MRRSAVTRRYEKGALIHDGGSECLGMLLVLSGEIRTYILSDEGREVTLYRLYPDDLCVLSASCVISQITFDTQVCAQRETEVLIIPASIVAALREQNLLVRCFLYELATQRFSDVMWAMQQILFKSLDRRLATFLLAEAERTGSSTIRMTHEQIAQHISCGAHAQELFGGRPCCAQARRDRAAERGRTDETAIARKIGGMFLRNHVEKDQIPVLDSAGIFRIMILNNVHIGGEAHEYSRNIKR